MWPARLSKLMRWLGRLRVVVFAAVTRRMMTGVHIALMAVVLAGWAAPPALAVTLARQLKTEYLVALQRGVQAGGELAAYRKIRQEFTATTGNPVLTSLVTDVRDAGGAPRGSDRVTSSEAGLARRQGELQALTIEARAPAAAVQAAEQAAARRAGFDAPVRSEAGLDSRLHAIEAKESADDAAAKRAEQAGDLAASAVASAISIPHLSDAVVVQIAREYLIGLVEGSPLKDVFGAWASRLAGAPAPPGAERTVVPDAARLERLVSQAENDACPGCARPAKPPENQPAPPEEGGGGE